MRYNKHYNTRETPQSQPIPGSDQVKNSAGGFSFAVDKWTRFDRFLILGTEGGSYYANENKLTVDNADSVRDCIKSDGVRVVKRIVEISDAGRAPKNDAAIFALAMAAKLGNDETRKAAREALPKVCRIGTHLFQFADNVESFGGWGRGTRKAVARWYNDKPADRLALQAVKYQQRNGWSHRDLLRLSHPKAGDKTVHNAIYRWIVKGEIDSAVNAPLIHAFEQAKRAEKKEDIVRLITEYRLPHECVPTQFKSDPEVQEALLQHMPMTATIRNLANMTRSGLLRPLGQATGTVIDRITDRDSLRKARVHPIQVLVAAMTYKAGRGMKGSNTWTPVGTIVDALDEAFYASFDNVVPTGKRIMLALDVSGSMGGGMVGGVIGLSPRIASAAMAMVIARTERNHMFTAFTGGGWGRNQELSNISELAISPRQRLDDVIRTVSGLPFGGTDCALPMLYAQGKKLDVDAFIVLTDSETWAGRIHPSQALQGYRASSGIPAKSVVVGMVANGFTIADPNDGGMMDVIGFDTVAPTLIADFIR